MTDTHRAEIQMLRLHGLTYKQIADELNLSVNTIKSFCRRNDVTAPVCKNCGKPIVVLPKSRKRVFCGDRCRGDWWRNNSDATAKKTVRHFTCNHCKQPFESYGNKARKYCSHACYIEDRYSPP